MLKKIFLTTGYKFALFMGLAVFLLLLLLRYAFPNNQPWEVYMVSSMLVYGALLVFAIHSFKAKTSITDFRLPVAFLAGAVPVFLATVLSASLILVFLTFNPESLELFKEQTKPTIEQFKHNILVPERAKKIGVETEEQYLAQYEEFIKAMDDRTAIDFARKEVSSKLIALFFVNLLAAMYFRSSAQNQ